MSQIKTTLLLSLWIIVLPLGCKGQIKPENSSSKAITETNQSPIPYEDAERQQSFYPNGQLKSEGQYQAGLKEGLHREWQDNGVLSLEGFYTKGKAHGLMKWFHEGGHLAGSGNMLDGIRVGPWMICDVAENGFCIEANFKNGLRDGIWKIYHESARDKLWKQQTWKEDKMITEKCWDEKGATIDCI